MGFSCFHLPEIARSHTFGKSHKISNIILEYNYNLSEESISFNTKLYPVSKLRARIPISENVVNLALVYSFVIA
jgi:hypothetical protein